MKVSGWFHIVIGSGILVAWVLLVAAGDVPEIAAGQRDIWFHIAAEAATGVVLIAAGVALLRNSSQARVLSALALGALFYTAVNSPGYYADRGDWAVAAMFLMVALASGMLAANLLRSTAFSEVPMFHESESSEVSL
jgi:hypothetical protein